MLIFALFLAVTVVVTLQGFFAKKEKDKWNNGFCKCGKKWEFTKVDGHKKLYQCHSCGEVFISTKAVDYYVGIIKKEEFIKNIKHVTNKFCPKGNELSETTIKNIIDCFEAQLRATNKNEKFELADTINIQRLEESSFIRTDDSTGLKVKQFLTTTLADI